MIIVVPWWPIEERGRAPPARSMTMLTTTRRSLLARRSQLLFLVAGLLVASGVPGTSAAFVSQARNPSNAFAAGTVRLADDSSGAAMLSLSNLRPGDTASSCVKVTYSGSLPATVTVYGTVAGTLGSYVTLTLTRGTSTGTFPQCAAFVPDATGYVTGEATGVMWSGTMSSFPSSYGTGLADPTTASPATWTNGTTVAYRVDVTMNDTTSSANLTGSLALTWEARNT